MNTTSKSDFELKNDLSFYSPVSKENYVIKADQIAEVLVNANKYLASLTPMFADIGFDIYELLGQRNLSGFVGEVFSKSFGKVLNEFQSNPHADGRPDILDLTSKEAQEFFLAECFITNPDGTKTIKRTPLAPFKYGGIEVKSSIGNPVSDYKKRLQTEKNVSGFLVGMPRVEYLNSITFWGHHKSCSSLIGLYYDYVSEVGGSPQILAVMYAELDTQTDWHEVSVGKVGSKKTSNTSLTTSGRDKLYANVIAITKDSKYQERLAGIGLKLP